MFPTITPLTATGDYHIVTWSPAANSGAPLTTIPELGVPELMADYDGEVRPLAITPDRGADEVYADPVFTGIYSIAGRVRNRFWRPIPGIQMRVVGTDGAAAGLPAITDSTGRYTFPGLSNGSYIVTPFTPGTYSPTSITVTINNANRSNQDFFKR
jgi:hypothetical protein